MTVKTLSRRALIKSSLTATALAATASIPTVAASASLKWTHSTQVLVVGGGFAGLTAAVTARRAGASVMLLDKRAWFGGDGVLSAGLFYSARTPFHDELGLKNVEVSDYWKQIESGVDDEPLSKVRDNLRESVIYSGVNKHNPAVLHHSAEYSPKVVEFVRSYGIKFRKMSPAKPFQLPTEKGSMGQFAKGMVEELKASGVKILPLTRATELVVNSKGRVIGVKATGKDGKEITVRAGAVVLATGGFLNNPKMMERYKRFWSKIPVGFSAVGDGVPMDHTGDGILMAKKIGGAIEDMESMPKLYAGPQKGTPGISWIMFDVDTAYLVTRAGKRICNEHVSRYSGCALRLLSTGNDVGFAIFDEKTFAGPNRDRWGFDNALAKGGLFKADTPEELAAKVGVDPKGLRQTIDRLAADGKAGKDTEFGRTDRMFRGLEAPYYITAPNWPLSYKTEGGIEVTPDFQVIRAADEAPIAGLYAVGSTCGSISTRLCDVVASGLIVGPVAAKAAK